MDNGNRSEGLPGRDTRGNGLAEKAPDPGRLVLVTGGGGYIGSVLVGKLLARGYEVRVLDRLYWGKRPLDDYLDRIELVHADVRDMPATALDGVDAVIHLAGLSNDPTAEYDPEANWQMNAVATEALGRACLEREVERLVFASSCSLYDGLPPGMHDERAPVSPVGAYATSKRYAEERLIELQATACPRSSCATARCTATVRACASTSWSTRSSRTRSSTAACCCTAAAGCGARWSTCATAPTR